MESASLLGCAVVARIHQPPAEVSEDTRSGDRHVSSLLGERVPASSSSRMEQQEEQQQRLYDAASCGNVDGVQAALWAMDAAHRHRSVNARFLRRCRETVLHAASRKGHSATVCVLLDAGANVDSIDNFGGTPLHDVCRFCPGSLQIVGELIRRGANVSARNSVGETPLHCACRRGHLEIVRELIRRGADIYAKNEEEETPLGNAIRSNAAPAVVEYVLRHYQEKIFESEGSRSLLTILRQGDDYSEDGVVLPIGTVHTDQLLSLCRYVVEHDPDTIRERDSHGNLPLHIACRKGAPFEVIQGLLEHDSTTLHIANNDGALPIHLACGCDASLRAIKHLVEQDPDSIRKRDGNGNLPLHIACHYSTPVGAIQYLVKQDPATLHIPNSDGALPIHLACRARASLNDIKFLVEDSGGVSTLCARDNSGQLPLHSLCGSDEPELKVVECLIKTYPAALSTRTTSNGDLPVTLACESASLSVIYSLVRGDPQVVSL